MIEHKAQITAGPEQHSKVKPQAISIGLIQELFFSRSSEVLLKKRLAKQFGFDSVFLESVDFVFIKSVLTSMKVHHSMC